MAIPLIPLIAGAAVGAIATYIYKDKASRKALKKSIKKTGEKLSEGADSVKSVLKKTKTQAEKTSPENTTAEPQASEAETDEKPASSSKRKSPGRTEAATKTLKPEE